MSDSKSDRSAPASHVFGPRVHADIALRRTAARSIRAAQRTLNLLQPIASGTSGRLGILFTGRSYADNFASIVAHACWQLSDHAGLCATQVDFLVPSGVTTWPTSFPQGQVAPVQIPAAFRLVDARSARLSDYGLLLLTDARSHVDPRVVPHMGRTRIVDESFFDVTACKGWEMAREILITPDMEAQFERESASLLRRLVQSAAAFERVVVLGTGPSIQEVRTQDMSDAFVVSCNSIVKNDELLAHLRPRVICFADPVFHTSSNLYAAAFRDDLLKVARRDADVVFCVPRHAHGLLTRKFPELQGRLLSVRYKAGSRRAVEPAHLLVRPTENILTLLMLPIAVELGRTIDIGGCDGRKPDANYFWEHDRSTQYSGLMAHAFDVHPAFFRDRLYDQYYDRHLRELDGLMSWARSRGRRFRAVTSSWIPSLSSLPRVNHGN